jgi:D-alanine-D-alanine ligase
MRVLVLYNSPTVPAEHPIAAAEADVLHTVEFVAAALAQAGWEVHTLGISDDPLPLMRRVAEGRPDVVFNLYEGTALRSETEIYAAGLLDWLRLPYTGARPAAMLLARDKVLAKRLFRAEGLPTADFVAVTDITAPVPVSRWPVFVKPATQDASVGIDHGSVVSSAAELAGRLRWLAKQFPPPYLIESYLPGREFNVGIIDDPDPVVLPIAEILFDRSHTDLWPIVSYKSKWEPGSREDLAAVPHCPAEVDADLQRRLSDLALSAYRLLGCRDYARVDLRTDAEGEPFILEVNPNPDFSPQAGLARALKVSGRDQVSWTIALCRRRAAERA